MITSYSFRAEGQDHSFADVADILVSRDYKTVNPDDVAVRLNMRDGSMHLLIGSVEWSDDLYHDLLEFWDQYGKLPQPQDDPPFDLLAKVLDL